MTNHLFAFNLKHLRCWCYTYTCNSPNTWTITLEAHFGLDNLLKFSFLNSITYTKASRYWTLQTKSLMCLSTHMRPFDSHITTSKFIMKKEGVLQPYNWIFQLRWSLVKPIDWLTPNATLFQHELHYKAFSSYNLQNENGKQKTWDKIWGSK